jgi:hypothetical protein
VHQPTVVDVLKRASYLLNHRQNLTHAPTATSIFTRMHCRPRRCTTPVFGTGAVATTASATAAASTAVSADPNLPLLILAVLVKFVRQSAAPAELHLDEQAVIIHVGIRAGRVVAVAPTPTLLLALPFALFVRPRDFPSSGSLATAFFALFALAVNGRR